MSGTTQSKSSGSNGFFGLVESILKPSANFIGNYALPNWTAKQFGLQSADQLFNPTFDPRFSPPRIDGGIPNTGNGFDKWPNPNVQPVLFDNNELKIDATALAVGAAAIVGVILVVKFA